MKEYIILITAGALLSALIISVMSKDEQKPKLIGTAADLEGVERILNKYFYSTSYKVDPETLAVSNSAGPFEKIQVKLKRGRYRIEMK